MQPSADDLPTYRPAAFELYPWRMGRKGTTPWRTQHTPYDSRVFDREGYLLASFVGKNHVRNARLFAAAPDLYHVARFVARESPECKCGACAPCVARWVIRRVT